MNKISIIIPVFNEAEHITNLFNHLIKSSSKENISEIIIVDGGSTDKTQFIINKFISRIVTSSDSDDSESYRETYKKVPDTKFSKKNFTRPNMILINSEKGRAKQMNKGAEIANGNILYFLHADSYPPKNFDSLIIEEVKKNNLSGCFKMKFDTNNLWLKLASWFTQFSWKSCRGGDQSQFITKTFFNDIGGFDEQFTIYEDNDLISKLYARKQFIVIQECLTTSARCYNTNGICKLQFHYWTIHLKKWFGASPKKLNKYYLKYVNVKN